MTHRSKPPLARRAATGFALVAALSLGAGDAFARAGGGKSAGSRGTMSRSAPPPTDTAPRQAQPLPGAQTPAAPSLRQGTAGAAAQAAQPSRMRSMMGGFAMGFLGAGLFGLLSGQGFFSGIGSLLGMLGFVLQIALVFFIVRWAINYFRGRQAAPAGAAPGNGYARQPMQPDYQPQAASAAGMGAAAGVAAAPGRPGALELQERDFNAFERLLGEIQDAYGRGDRTGIAVRATPEMGQYFADDLRELEAKGLANRLSNIKLLQGDLAEAWREPGAEYATVAMRYAVTDAVVEIATGRVVDGDLNQPQEVTEVWTFVRRPGETSEGWKLSAIQQT